MSFEGDVGKARANLTKHGIEFPDAVGVFEDERALTVPDDHPTEERCTTIGADFLGQILVVSYTFRGETIRLISARKATSREQKEYE